MLLFETEMKIAFILIFKTRIENKYCNTIKSVLSFQVE